MSTRRHALTDAQWARIAHLFAPTTTRGRPGRPARHMLDAALWILKTGAQWRDLPERFGPWQSAYDRFRRWRLAGTFDRAVAHLQRDLDRDGLIDWSAFCIDSTTVRASRAAAGARKRGPSSRASRRIMRWGGVAAVLRPSCTWSPIAEDSRSASS